MDEVRGSIPLGSTVKRYVGAGALLALVLAGVTACSPARDAKEAPPRAEPAVPDAGPPSRAVACASDRDCRVQSSYCSDAPCSCSAVGRAAPDRRCSDVACLVDPCARKTAACQAGRCELVTAAPP